MAELKQLIEGYLQKTILMQLATVKDGKPWACTVHYANDRDLNLYWLSRPTRRHSEELRANPCVAGVIVQSHEIGQPAQGLQFEGLAEVADGLLKKSGQSALKSRFGMEGAEDHLLYVLKPRRIVLFDTVRFPDQPQQEYRP